MRFRNASTLKPLEVSCLSVALLAGLAPHMARFPLLLSLAFIGAAMWRVLGAFQRLPLPEREYRVLWILKQVLAVAAFISVYVAYRGQLGREAGVELLAALLGLKLLEMRTPRDFYVAAFLCYFLVVTNFFYSQTMLTAAYMLALVVGITSTLILFNTPAEFRRPGTMLRLASVMLVQALPLMVVCFVLFPRIPGPLWGLPQDAFDAVTGLSNEMRVGEITRLGISDEIAFRVEFEDTAPVANDLYWRGPVLWYTDGEVWRAGGMGNGPPKTVERLGPEHRYNVMLEPHHKRWLLGLDMVVQAPRTARRGSDASLRSAKRVRRRERYALTSVVDYRVLEISREERKAALALPPGWHPQARALARSWRDSGMTSAEIVEHAYRYFNDNAFYYSLTPPPLPRDAVDQFLFETREGFCEHFANAFVILMRAAGIPARIVTGYQGGEYNRVAEYMTIRQRDAHAWAEVYDEQRGWVRVDPTAAVAPERVSLGIERLTARRNQQSNVSRDGSVSEFWGQVRDTFDAITYGWNQWVLGYTPQSQRLLLDDLGLEDWNYGDLIIVLTTTLAALILLLGFMLVRIEKRVVDPIQRAWLEFCARLARVGLPRAPSEAPHAFARRVMLARADLAQEVSRITRLYTQSRYGRTTPDTETLHRRVKRFRPRKRN